MPVDLSFFDTRLFVFFGDVMTFKNDASDMEASNAISAIRSSQTVKVMPEWIWPFSSSKELLVELFSSQTLYSCLFHVFNKKKRGHYRGHIAMQRTNHPNYYYT